MKKINNKKGFTLAELLIVVAIIGVLTAIAIPVFTSQLEKSRDATTIANIRSAYAEASALYLAEPSSSDATSGNAAKTGPNTVVVSNVSLPCTCGNADTSALPFGITLSGNVPSDNASITFEFATDGGVTAGITGGTSGGEG